MEVCAHTHEVPMLYAIIHLQYVYRTIGDAWSMTHRHCHQCSYVFAESSLLSLACALKNGISTTIWHHLHHHRSPVRSALATPIEWSAGILKIMPLDLYPFVRLHARTALQIFFWPAIKRTLHSKLKFIARHWVSARRAAYRIRHTLIPFAAVIRWNRTMFCCGLRNNSTQTFRIILLESIWWKATARARTNTTDFYWNWIHV